MPRTQIFSTKGGRIGLGPDDAEPGDKICVLYHGAPLFILHFKDDGDAAVLVRDAYVHGLMTGEVLSMDGRNEDEDFILC